MSGDSYEVPPLSRSKIRATARKVRDLVQLLSGPHDAGGYFDIVRFLDIQMPEASPEFALEVVSEAQMRELHGDAHAITIPTNDLIQVREDIWERAVEGEGRDRFTLAHELGHYVLHARPGFARRRADGRTPPYRQSEWQANALAGELLVPALMAGTCSGPAPAAQVFGVSLDAAQVQWKVFKKDRIV